MDKTIQKKKILIRVFSMLILSLGFYSVSHAQSSYSLSGTVSSEDGSSNLPGATVLVKGTSRGTITDDHGGFQISVGSGDTLVITSVGFQKSEIAVNNRRNIEVRLSSVSGTLDQLVVVGYGTQKKATATGAVEVVSSDVFKDRAVTNPALALQGETPGLLVTRTSPRPGNEGISFRIRGASSVNGNDPLIIVDGVPVLNYFSFQNMNPDDIESISVLKDASAAIYGSRAANGVILVTTKTGKKGKLKIDYNGNFRFNTNGITSYSPSMQEYATMWLEANKEEEVPNWWVWSNKETMLRMQQGIEGAYDLFGTDFFIYNANRIDELFRHQFSYQHTLDLSGGGDKNSYRISLNYANNRGDLATAYDGQKQYNLRLKFKQELFHNFNLTTNLNLIDARTSTPSVGLNNTLYAYDMPFYPAKNPFGNWFATFNGIDGGAIRNAVAATSDGGRDDKNSLTGSINVMAEYKFLNDFSIEGVASLQNERFNEERWVVPVPLYNWFNVQTGITDKTNGTDNTYYTDAYSGYSQYYRALLHYNKTFRQRHEVSFTGGVEAEKMNTNSISGTRVGFENRGVQNIGLAETSTQTNGGSKGLNGRYSYLARLNYGFMDKYLIELQGRRDGNSRFAEGFKFKNFGGASIGWVFSKEHFFNQISHIVDFGKIRLSYGVSGNEASNLGQFDYLSGVNIGTVVLGNPASLQTSSSLNRNGLVSLTRTWERVKQQNVGIDLEFLNNRLSGTFDYFKKENIGMLVNVNYPSVLGGSAPQTNSGNFRTKGWEFVVSWKDYNNEKEFNYNISVNLSNNHTLVYGVEGADNYGPGKNGIVNGLPWQPWFVYQTDGYFQNQKEVDDYYAQYGSSDDLSALPQGNPQVELRPGDTKKVDVAGTNNITGAGNEESSLVYAGDGTPHYTFGLNLGGSWRGLDVSAFFQGQFKQNIMRNGYMAYPWAALYTNQNPSFLGKTWTEDHTDAIFPRLTVNPTRAKWDYVNNDFMLQNNRYVRLKSLIVGYTFPQKWTKRAHIDRIRIYFSGNDLWEAVSIKDGFDPEMGEASIDSGYPFSRTWSFGINIGF